MSLPRMSLHIGDYKKDTGHLRAAGHGAYFLLTMHYWATGGLPNDDAQLAAIACMSDREWKKHKPVIKAFFKAGEWKHKRIDAEIADAQEKYERRASAGKRGGEAKAKAKQPPSNATAKAKQPITLTEEEGVVEGRAAREASSVSEEAFQISEEILSIFKIDREFVPPGWCGAAMRIQSGLNIGWNREVILLAAQKIAAKGFTPDGFAYLEKPIAREHADAQKPLPTAKIQSGETVDVQANQRHPGGAYGASKDRFRQAHAALKASIAADDAGETSSGSVVEFLSAAGRE